MQSELVEERGWIKREDYLDGLSVPSFHRSSFLNGRDLFGECVKAAKSRGIGVYARMSPDIQWTDPKLLDTHPLWFCRNPDGSLQSSAPNIAFTCQFSGHFSEQQLAIIGELNKRYDIDGVYMNGWPNASPTRHNHPTPCDT